MFAACDVGCFLQKPTVKSSCTFEVLGSFKTIETSKVKLSTLHYHMVMCLWGHGMEDSGLKVMCLGVKFTKNGVVPVSAHCCIDSI